MNNSSSANVSSNLNVAINQALLDLLTAADFFNTTSNYILTPICSLGFLLNLICLVVFFNKDMDKKTYFYFKAKTMGELVVMLIGAASTIVLCTSCTSAASSLMIQIYIAYFTNGTTTIAYTFLGFMELMVVYDRYVIVKPTAD
jgi:hypothetical protein